MAKRSILQKNNHKLSAPNGIDNQIIEYLISLKNKSATQADAPLQTPSLSLTSPAALPRNSDIGSVYHIFLPIASVSFRKTPTFSA